jgi:hypothetical protein
MEWFSFEMTDLFGGEANYSWVRRWKLKAANYGAALKRFSRLSGYRGWRTVSAHGDQWQAILDCSPITVFVEFCGDSMPDDRFSLFVNDGRI